jgi:hypothetical protein
MPGSAANRCRWAIQKSRDAFAAAFRVESNACRSDAVPLRSISRQSPVGQHP